MCACGDGWSRSKRALEFYLPPTDKRERFAFIQMRINIIWMNANESQQLQMIFVLIHLFTIILLVFLDFYEAIIISILPVF